MTAVRTDSEAHEDLARVPLDAIIASPDFQVRDRLDTGTVRAYEAVMRGGGEFPPVLLAQIDGAAGLFLLDGFHRVSAARRADLGTIPAITLALTAQEARWRAAEANLRNGLRLRSRRERRAVFDAYMAAKRYRKGKHGFKSLREIAADLGGLVNFTTIRNWLIADHPKLWASRYAGEGKTAANFDAPSFLEAGAIKAAREALGTIRAAHQAIQDEKAREALAGDLERLLREVDGSAPGDDADDF